ncbi:MAG: dUTP diphosphatase [Pseudomonadota bacterium]
MKIPIQVLPERDPALPLPECATPGAAGRDVSANLNGALRESGLRLPPGERDVVPTGFALAIPTGFEVQLRPRSGLARRYGLTLLNSPATIDSDYRGEIGVLLINLGKEDVIVTHGMRIAQMIVVAVATVEFELTTELGATARGTDGFGSTGVGSLSSPSGRPLPS